PPRPPMLLNSSSAPVGKNCRATPMPALEGALMNALSASVIALQRSGIVRPAGAWLLPRPQVWPEGPRGQLIEPDLSTKNKRLTGMASPSRALATQAASMLSVAPLPAPPVIKLPAPPLIEMPSASAPGVVLPPQPSNMKLSARAIGPMTRHFKF